MTEAPPCIGYSSGFRVKKACSIARDRVYAALTGLCGGVHLKEPQF